MPADAVERATHNAIFRWCRIFEILGLDSAAPLYPELGLNPAHAMPWRTAARQFLSAYYAWMDAHRFDNWATADGVRWVRDALSTATELVDVTAAQGLYAWGMGTFFDNDEEPNLAYVWGLLLWTQCSANVADFLPTGLPPARQALLTTAVDQLLLPTTSALRDPLVATMTSAWDQRIYRYYQQAMEDPEGDMTPLDWASSTIEYRRVRDVWAVLERAFSPTDFAVLQAWGQQQAPAARLDPARMMLPAWPASRSQLATDQGVQAEDIAIGVGAVAGTAAAGSLIYRGVRLLPALLPPLWPTLPVNAYGQHNVAPS